MSTSVGSVPCYSARHIAFIAPIMLMHIGCGLVPIVGVSPPALVVFLVSIATSRLSVSQLAITD